MPFYRYVKFSFYSELGLPPFCEVINHVKLRTCLHLVQTAAAKTAG